MRIGIIGTRGIPNQYGGFEQFTEFIAPLLVERGHEVFVYNSSLHPYQQKEWKGVQLIKKYDPENKIGTAGQFIYDFNCVLDARKRKFDIFLQLGYTSSSIWSFLFPKNTSVITNMDGLEWKRSKYSPMVKKFLRKAEKWAVRNSHFLIADSIGIQQYLSEKYNVESTFISYGAENFQNPQSDRISAFKVTPYCYNMLIARMEPENNIETILSAYAFANPPFPLLVVGNHHANAFGKMMFEKYKSDNIRFTGPIYDMALLNNLRHYSNLYFHGHSVGGTNPSLLEAMASGCLIIAHDNIFNRSVLNENALYFSSTEALAGILQNNPAKKAYTHFTVNNYSKIREFHSWEYICTELEKLFTNASAAHK
ncbi:MAG: DUF1972 domain-containing protein [Chitinophagaceae bacterium]